MCKAFSCIVTQSGKVYWKAGLDSHKDIINLHKEDLELKDDKMPPNNTFARIEITPKDGDYLNIRNKWIYKIDQDIVPSFLTDKHKLMCSTN